MSFSETLLLLALLPVCYVMGLLTERAMRLAARFARRAVGFVLHGLLAIAARFKP